MIDLNEMNKHQEEGLMDINSLQGMEMEVLRHYCSLATEAFLTLGVQAKAPFDKVVHNAYRDGIALGLHLQIKDGTVEGRQ